MTAPGDATILQVSPTTTYLETTAMVSTTSTTTDQIYAAVLGLQARCDGAATEDGQGFNKYDAQWGKTAAADIASGRFVSPVYALKVVSKYRRQVAAMGLALPDLATVQAEADAIKAERAAVVAAQKAAAPSTPTQPDGVEIGLDITGKVRIRFSYNQAHVDTVKTLPGRLYDAATKSWTVPKNVLPAAVAAFPDAVLVGELGAELAALQAAQDLADRARVQLVTTALAKYDAIKPGGLFTHQDEGIRWLIENQKCILADDMGLGKSRQALVAARSLGHRIFVVGPAGLRINWMREAAMVGAEVEYYSWSKVPEAPEGSFTLIADEAHYAQNMKAQRTKRFLALAKAAVAVFSLTGTPIKNGRPANLFPLLVAANHHLARDRKLFEIRYCNAGPTKFSRWDVTGAAHLDELHRKIGDVVLRRMKTECLDLPEKVRVLKKAELSADAQATYTETLRAMQAQYQDRKAKGEIGEADTLVLMNHLRHAGSIAKVESAVELAEETMEQGGQVVLFTAFLDSAEQIAQALHAVKITGAEDAAARQANVDAFQAGTVKAIVCTLGAGNVGITLTAAQTVILVDRPWTPGDAIQAEDRLHRIGQRGSVLAVWLQANGADEAIDNLLEQKHERIELVLAGKRKSLRGMTSVRDVAEAVLG